MLADHRSSRSENSLELSALPAAVAILTARGLHPVRRTCRGRGVQMLKAVCKLGLEGIVLKKLDSPYRSGQSKNWIKVKNPKAPAATRAQDGTF
jgi:ATP-dependent DNA ligase